MKVKVFQPNHNGKIEFTRAELERLLNEVYSDGYREGEAAGQKHSWTWTSPYMYSNGLSTVTTSGTPLTINSSTTQPIDKLVCTYDSATNKNNTSIAKNPTVDVAPISVSVNSADNKAVEKHIAQTLESIGCTQATLDDIFTNLAKELTF